MMQMLRSRPMQALDHTANELPLHGNRPLQRFFSWIWQIRGSVPLAPGQSNEEAFGRLDPLFRQTGTSHERAGDTLTFRKKGSAAQDRMAIFDEGILKIERGAAGPMLRYRMTSRALLACFLAPLLFLAFAQFTIAVDRYEKEQAKHEPKKPEKKDVKMTLHPIDKALGAPEPVKPKKEEKHSPKPSYVFAALFAVLYLIGRVLEDRLARSLFRKKLLGL